ncbi:peroxisome biogenesis factor 10 [Tilletia horrida]|uniref:RING-type E3 ubiquitin transferase n=1 Tax=Tilletia horrida TaxID=155126 RepID=A0AAN6GSV0_9BASI|nr:peroxisome biogenesis factor 10 [Tilletia horrida]KAK0551993.1 peroxisome biogenesis factor 10 [Tilletia horrida]KAK0566162.1 peroxisome biogenesis factor 10 [Tilletia horrida]
MAEPTNAGTIPSAQEGEGSSSAALAGPSNPSFSFPPAAQPSIIRAYQKDAYYQHLFRTSLADTVRSLVGARFLAQHAENISLVAGLAYWVLAGGLASASGGTQTLGEEYVNTIMVESRSGKIASRRRRLLFVIFLALVPTVLSRSYAALRRYAQRRASQLAQLRERARLRAAAIAAGGSRSQQVVKPSRREALFSFLAKRMPSLESFDAPDGWMAYLGAAHLAVFYLGGRYYGLAQRAARVQYISTIPPNPNSQPPSYEILGMLLSIQLGVKLLLTVRARLRESNRREQEEKEAEAEAEAEKHGYAQSRGGASDQNQQRQQQDPRTMRIDDQVWTHETAPASLVRSRKGIKENITAAHNVPLLYPSSESDTLLTGNASSSSSSKGISAQVRNKTAQLVEASDALLRCTLCMEQRTPEKGNSAVTECGHVFCWDCITNWAREKPECPLCRQSLVPSRLLPVYNF